MNIDNLLKKNKELKGIHKNKRCFIIGNGPSLANQDLLWLKNDIKLVVNDFYKGGRIKDINPHYWLIADPIYWEKGETELKPLLKAIEMQEIHPKLFLPVQTLPIKIEKEAFLNIHFFGYDSSLDIDRDIDFSHGIPLYSQNVISVALMLAFYLGCHPIYLIGCDHTWWKFQREGYSSQEVHHFYNASYRVSEDLSYDILQSTIWVQKFQYLQLMKYAQKRGIQIFNATEGGYLNLFPRVKYADLFLNGVGPIDANTLISEIPNISFVLGQSAIKLMKEGELFSALTLLDAAISQNRGKDSRTEGLDYLKALCFMKLGNQVEAIKAARQDYLCNPSNRVNSLNLLRSLGDELYVN